MYSNNLELVINEILNLGTLNHKNIVKLVEVIDDKKYSELYMVIEYAKNGQIIEFDNNIVGYVPFKNLKEIPEEKIKSIMRDLIMGLNYLHNQKMVHLDIKPENILMDEDNVSKITDFTTSVKFLNNDDRIYGNKGTFLFMSPESITSKEKGYSGRLFDIWCLGICLYCFTYDDEYT